MKPLYVSLKPFLDHGALPRPVAWGKVFGNPNPVEVEIGFGNGEYLARISNENPSINYVGFEEYCERIARTLRKLSRVPFANSRVMRMDARTGLTYLFAQRSIKAIHCLFPPPWPKKSDIKHRLFTPQFLNLLNSRLVDGGILKVVTDHKPYANWVVEQVPGTGFSVDHRTIPASYGTKFEQKWQDGGQTEFDEIILTKTEHREVPHKEDSPLNQYTIDRFSPDKFQMGEYSKENIAVVFKEFLYDQKRQIALVHTLVHDESLVQNVRVMISRNKEDWRVHLAQGSMLMPTPGVAMAIQLVRDAALESV